MKRVSNIDTIYILINIHNYEIKSIDILKFLENEKEKAKLEIKSNANSKHFVTISGMVFEILSNGTKGYAYILHNSGYEVKIAQYQSKIKNFMPIQIRISAEYLWSKGLKKSWEEIKKWVEETFGIIGENKISRVDLCTHTSDIDFIENYELSYKGKFKKDSVNVLNYTHKKINSITFGSRKGKNIYCRIYNKTLEVTETKRKNWFFEIWKKNNLDVNNVWNLEFELKSEFLREFKIKTIDDLEKSIKDIWKYCTCEWLLKIDRTNIRSERCPINKQWIEIQNAFDEFNSIGLIKREKQIETEADVLIPNIVGNITSYAARKDITNIDGAFESLYKNSKVYLEKHNKSFEEETKKKKYIINERGCK